MEVMKAAGERAATGAGVLHLEVGQPWGAPPPSVRRAAAEAAAAGELGYTDAPGLWELRARIAGLYRERYAIPVDPAQVLVTTGASAGIVLAVLACFDAGSRVALGVPGYPCYRQVLAALGVEAVLIPSGPGAGFRLDASALDGAGAVDGVIVASPANPTGTVLSSGDLEGLRAWCTERGAWLIVDEIYHGITYGCSAPSAVGPGVVVLGSFSKYWSMTGWRVGWMVAPPELTGVLERLAQNLYISPPTVSQLAAVAACDATADCEARVRTYARNRQVLLEALRRAGVRRIAPADGAFYLYAETAHLEPDSVRLAERWLDEIGVAVTPGVDFDPFEGRRWTRFSYAGDPAVIAEAADRIVAWSVARTSGGPTLSA